MSNDGAPRANEIVMTSQPMRCPGGVPSRVPLSCAPLSCLGGAMAVAVRQRPVEACVGGAETVGFPTEDGGMTMTISVPRHPGPWTIDDLYAIPDDGYRYEIADGSLLVSPPPPIPHLKVNERRRRVLAQQAPPEFRVLAVGGGIEMGRRTTSYIPDVMVVPDEFMNREGRLFYPADVLLVVEVLSPSNAGKDLVQIGRA